MDSSLQPPADGPPEPSDFLTETLDGTADAPLPCVDNAAQLGPQGGQAPGGPALPCCFRRLSDPLLPAPPADAGSLVHLEALERDALLEDAASPAEAHKLARHPQDGAGLWEKDVKKKLESGSPKARSGSLPQVEEMDREEGPGAGRRGRHPALLERSPLDRENLNNNNSKRSCPEDFEVGGGPWGGALGLPVPPRSAPSSLCCPLTWACSSRCGSVPEGDSGLVGEAACGCGSVGNSPDPRGVFTPGTLFTPGAGP